MPLTPTEQALFDKLRLSEIDPDKLDRMLFDFWETLLPSQPYIPAKETARVIYVSSLGHFSAWYLPDEDIFRLILWNSHGNNRHTYFTFDQWQQALEKTLKND